MPDTVGKRSCSQGKYYKELKCYLFTNLCNLILWVPASETKPLKGMYKCRTHPSATKTRSLSPFYPHRKPEELNGSIAKVADSSCIAVTHEL